MNTYTHKHTQGITLFIILTSFCFITYSNAQTLDNSSNSQDSLDTSSIEVISITASKNPLALNDTPDSISSVLGADIDLISPQHINQVLDAIPGTWISRGNGQEHLTAIRSPVFTGAGGCGAFFMGLDGISTRAPSFCNANQLFDINYEQAARVDVLRSPASTLYGSNALHGVINVITPSAFNRTSNVVSFQAGAEDFLRLSNEFGVSDDKRSWLNLVNITQENGFQDESGYDQQKMTHIYQVNGISWQNKTVLDVSNLNQETAGFVQGFEVYKDKALRKTNPNPEAFRDAKSLRLYSQFAKSLEQGDLQITPYLRANSMTFLQHFLPWKALEENSHSSVGVQTTYRFSWNTLDWLVGFDTDFTRGSLTETQDQEFSPNIPQGVHYDYDVDVTQTAIYAQGVWQENNLSIRFGGRLERSDYDYDNNTVGRFPCAESVSVCRFSRPDDQNVAYNAFSPSVNMQYTLSDNMLIYAKYAQGFRAPQTAELFRLQNNQLVADIDNESMDSFEIGTRITETDYMLHLASFYMTKDNVIFQNSDRQNVSNGQTKHFGLEAELRYAIADSLNLAGHISYAKHEYTKDTDLVNTNIQGNEIDTAPNWMSNVNLTYTPLEKLSAQVSVQYLSSYYLNPENTAKYDGHTLVDLNLKYALSDTISMSLNLFNLTDRAYAERADIAFGNYRYFIGQPRRAFLKVQWLY